MCKITPRMIVSINAAAATSGLGTKTRMTAAITRASITASPDYEKYRSHTTMAAIYRANAGITNRRPSKMVGDL